MEEFIKKQLDNHLIVLVYLLALKDKRYDLVFKMLGGQNEKSYKTWRNIKNWYLQAKGRNSMDDLCVVLNPDGTVFKNLHFISIALALDLPVQFIRKTTSPSPVSFTNLDWLKSTFNNEEVNLILKEKEKWKNKTTNKTQG